MSNVGFVGEAVNVGRGVIVSVFVGVWVIVGVSVTVDVVVRVSVGVWVSVRVATGAVWDGCTVDVALGGAGGTKREFANSANRMPAPIRIGMASLRSNSTLDDVRGRPPVYPRVSSSDARLAV